MLSTQDRLPEFQNDELQFPAWTPKQDGSDTNHNAPMISLTKNL